MGFPARVVSKAPDFPKEVSDKEKLDIFRDIVVRMVEFFVDSGLRCEQDGDCYTFSKPSSHWWRRNEGPWKLLVIDGDAPEAMHRNIPGPLHVLLSLREIPEEIRQQMKSKNTMWIEIAKKEQSRYSNDLGDEVSSFLKRYGVRTLRVPPLPSSSS